MDILFVCLYCEGTYYTTRHKGCHVCTPEQHYGFCDTCIKIVMRSFEQQMRRRELPKPRLRVEDDEGRLM